MELRIPGAWRDPAADPVPAKGIDVSGKLPSPLVRACQHRSEICLKASALNLQSHCWRGRIERPRDSDWNLGELIPNTQSGQASR